MMKITVERITADNDSTLSTIFVDGRFICFGLEDEYRTEKISGETRIPAGDYAIGLRRVGGFHARYGHKFAFHQGMLEVLNVPGFTNILIHIGNTDKDTAGCLLVGAGAFSGSGEMSLQQSKTAYQQFYSTVIQSAKNGDLTIHYINRGSA